jgi:hypothetical protein
MVDSERQRTYSTASYFPSPVLIAPNNDGTFLDDMSCRDPSFDIPRLTDKEVAEIIAEGPSIRARMERHKIDVEFGEWAAGSGLWKQTCGRVKTKRAGW